MAESLDHRKELILAAVVEEHISSGDPVGSMTVVKKGIKASPATVRKEMGELESAGLLKHPYTSAGRLPTETGFRYYVDHLIGKLKPSAQDKHELESLYRARGMSWRELVEETAGMLSDLTRQVGVVMVMRTGQMLLSSVHFRESTPGKIRVVLSFMGGLKEERIIKNEWGLTHGALRKLGNYVNSLAPGKTLTGLRRELIRQREDTRARADVLLYRAAELSERLVDMQRPELLVRGQANLFDTPELLEIDAIREVIRTLEETSLLVKMLESAALTSGTRVVIGGENYIGSLRHCSVVTSTYGRGEESAGALGVIGPTRMDYKRLVPLVHSASELLSECLRRYE